MPPGRADEHSGDIGITTHGGTIMKFPHKTPSLAALAAVALAVALAGPSPAAAKQDPGGPVPNEQQFQGATTCSLERVGAQLIHCDSLTGAGVSAPSWIPER